MHTHNINKITEMLSLRKLGVWQPLYVPASMHGAAICQNIWTCRLDWRREKWRGCVIFRQQRAAKASRRGVDCKQMTFACCLADFAAAIFYGELQHLSCSYVAPLLAPLPPCLWKKVVALLPHREHYYYTITFGSHLAESLANASSCFAKLSLQLKMALLW